MKKSKKGIILVFVLMVLASFSLMGIGLGFRARIENRLSQYFYAEQKTVYTAKAKLNQIMVKIAGDDNNYDDFNEDWTLKNDFDCEKDSNCRILVEDEDGKLDLNTAASDWLNNTSFLSETLKQHIIKQRPFFVEDEIFSAEDLNENEEILDLVTTQHHDKININTVREQVLYAMPELSNQAADVILSLRRSQPIDNLEVFKEFPGISINEYENLNKIFKTTSSLYTIKMWIEDDVNKIKKSFKITVSKNLNTKTVEIIRWLEQ